jgi:hypothetical protein
VGPLSGASGGAVHDVAADRRRDNAVGVNADRAAAAARVSHGGEGVTGCRREVLAGVKHARDLVGEKHAQDGLAVAGGRDRAGQRVCLGAGGKVARTGRAMRATVSPPAVIVQPG